MCTSCIRSGIFVVTLCLFASIVIGADRTKDGIGLSLHGGVMNFVDDVTPQNFGYVGAASVDLPLSRNFSVQVAGGLSQQQLGPTDSEFSTQLATFDICGALRLPITSFLWPKFYLGAGVINFQRGDWPRYWDAEGIAGGGIELKLSKRLGFGVFADYRYTSGDDFDGAADGSPDGYMTARAGLQYKFFTKDKKKESPLAAKVVEMDKQQKVDEEFLTRLLSANENSETSIVQDTATSDINIQMDDQIKSLKRTIAERDQAIARIKAEIQAADQRIALLEMELKGDESPTATTHLSDVSDFKEEYQIGIQKYNEKAYSEAIDIFASLLATDPANKLASNCQYWIGECEYASKNFDKAIAAFERALQYTNSPKADDALIMLGKSYRQMSQNEIAIQYFQRLLTEYPDSEYAALAQKYLGYN